MQLSCRWFARPGTLPRHDLERLSLDPPPPPTSTALKGCQQARLLPTFCSRSLQNNRRPPFTIHHLITTAVRSLRSTIGDDMSVFIPACLPSPMDLPQPPKLR